MRHYIALPDSGTLELTSAELDTLLAERAAVDAADREDPPDYDAAYAALFGAVASADTTPELGTVQRLTLYHHGIDYLGSARTHDGVVRHSIALPDSSMLELTSAELDALLVERMG